VASFRRRSPILFASIFLAVTAMLIAGGLTVAVSKPTVAHTPPLSAVTTGALRYFNANFHVGHKASDYRAHCKITSALDGLTSYTCQVVRGYHPTIKITAVFVTETQIGSGQNYATSYSFVPN
jgi:hypothetical protein